MIPIVIPTLGRERIITLDRFEPALLRYVTIVTSSSQVRALRDRYPKVKVVDCPCQHNKGTPRDPKVHGIEHVFQWMVENFGPKMLVAEDDMYFYVRKTKQWADKRTRPATPGEITDALLSMVRLTERYAMVGMSHKFGNNHHKAPLVVGTRMHGIWTLDCALAKKLGFRFNPPERPNFFMSDFYMNLCFLSAGYPTALIADTMFNPVSSNAPGGCSDYRNAQNQKLSAEFLAKSFPDSVKAVTKTTKCGWFGGERVDATVQWKKALQLGFERRELL